jgi:hypothetical protein
MRNEFQKVAKRLIVCFGDVVDINTLASMFYKYDQGRKSLKFYYNIIEGELK